MWISQKISCFFSKFILSSFYFWSTLYPFYLWYLWFSWEGVRALKLHPKFSTFCCFIMGFCLFDLMVYINEIFVNEVLFKSSKRICNLKSWTKSLRKFFFWVIILSNSFGDNWGVPRLAARISHKTSNVNISSELILDIKKCERK